MSLTFALGMTARGLMATENRMTISAQNITNADKKFVGSEILRLYQNKE